MELRVLRYFIEVVNQQNISKAANQLHLSQPTLSRQLMALESELGVTLFERGHRQIKLTEEGYYLYDRAREITSLADKTAANLHAQAVISGTIDIGAGESIAIQPVMDVLGKIITAHPNIKVNLVSGDENFIHQHLDNGTIDFGIVMGPASLNNYHSLRLPMKNRWGILMKKDHPLASHPEIIPEDLLNQQLLISAQAKQQDIFRSWAGSLIDQFNFSGYYNLIFNAQLLVRTGACIALSYEGLANLTGNDGLIFRPLAPAIDDQNNLIWAKNHQLSTASQLFIEQVTKKFKNKSWAGGIKLCSAYATLIISFSSYTTAAYMLGNTPLLRERGWRGCQSSLVYTLGNRSLWSIHPACGPRCHTDFATTISGPPGYPSLNRKGRQTRLMIQPTSPLYASP